MSRDQAGNRFDVFQKGTNNTQAEKVVDCCNATVAVCTVRLAQFIKVGVKTFDAVFDCRGKAMLLQNHANVLGNFLQCGFVRS